MSLFADYTRERLGDEIIESDNGFITYRYIDDAGVPAVYIVELYIRPEFRKNKRASEMADQVVSLAKDKGRKRLIGSVSSYARNSTDSIRVLLGYGMEFYRSNQDALMFKKEI